VSDEDEGLIDKVFIQQLGAKYPFVKAKGVNNKYGIKFFPSFFVIDSSGVVFSVPDDHEPSEQQIEELLKTASVGPKLPDDSRYDPLRSMWKKSEFAKVRDYLDKNLAAPNLDAGMKDVFTSQREQLQKRLDGTVARIGKLGEGPDYAAAMDQLEKIEKQWKGLPPADAATKELARFAADATIKKELAAGKALQKVMASFDAGKVAQRKKLLEALQQFRKKYEGTYAVKQADEQIAQLSKTG